jgi:hypothetical protein
MRNLFLIAAGVLALGLVPASAGSLYEEQVYADSYGNLIIHMPSGAKRILVGQGHRALDYSGYRYEGPAVVYLEDDTYVMRETADARHVRRCNRQPVLLHGRSHMYGLPENVIPVPAGICR